MTEAGPSALEKGITKDAEYVIIALLSAAKTSWPC